MIKYGSKLGGYYLIHDESLYELYSYNNWLPESFDKISPFLLREKNIIDKYLCFHEIIDTKSKGIIVHNKKLLENIKKVYKYNNINYIPFPNYNFNINNKLTFYENNKLQTIRN
jgi:hypothetical protein